MNTTHININSAAYRTTYRPHVETPAQRIARLERYIEEMAAFSWTMTYQDAQAELETLRSEQSARRRRYRPGRHWLWNAQMYATRGRLAALKGGE